MKSTISRAVIIVGVCLLLVGCAPTTGAKSILALLAIVVSIGAAVIGFARERHCDRVSRKAADLDREITTHSMKYHQED